MGYWLVSATNVGARIHDCTNVLAMVGHVALNKGNNMATRCETERKQGVQPLHPLKSFEIQWSIVRGMSVISHFL